MSGPVTQSRIEQSYVDSYEREGPSEEEVARFEAWQELEWECECEERDLRGTVRKMTRAAYILSLIRAYDAARAEGFEHTAAALRAMIEREVGL